MFRVADSTGWKYLTLKHQAAPLIDTLASRDVFSMETEPKV